MGHVIRTQALPATDDLPGRVSAVDLQTGARNVFPWDYSLPGVYEMHETAARRLAGGQSVRFVAEQRTGYTFEVMS